MAMEDRLNIHLLMVGNNPASLSMDYYYPRKHLRKIKENNMNIVDLKTTSSTTSGRLKFISIPYQNGIILPFYQSQH